MVFNRMIANIKYRLRMSMRVRVRVGMSLLEVFILERKERNGNTCQGTDMSTEI